MFSSRDRESKLPDAVGVKDRRPAYWDNTGRLVEVCVYYSENELGEQLRKRDVPKRFSRIDTLLVLNRNVRGNLRELIRRRHLASRLILNPTPGIWPGTDSAVDLSLARYSLGWNSIEVCRNLGLALHQVVTNANSNERAIVFWPVQLKPFNLTHNAAGS